MPSKLLVEQIDLAITDLNNVDHQSSAELATIEYSVGDDEYQIVQNKNVHWFPTNDVVTVSVPHNGAAFSTIALPASITGGHDVSYVLLTGVTRGGDLGGIEGVLRVRRAPAGGAQTDLHVVAEIGAPARTSTGPLVRWVEVTSNQIQYSYDDVSSAGNATLYFLGVII